MRRTGRWMEGGVERRARTGPASPRPVQGPIPRRAKFYNSVHIKNVQNARVRHNVRRLHLRLHTAIHKAIHHS
jgi:hypothetical protein